jgi:beta-phosphoglucomutase
VSESPRAVLFDFNGTLSHDEPILCEIFVNLFAEYGKPLSSQEYFDRLAGLSDPEIVSTWLGSDHPELDAILEERVRRYRAAVADGSTVPDGVRAAVRIAAERVPVGIVSGAALREIEPVLLASGLAGAPYFVVSSDDVVRGKPHPDGYVEALARLDGGIAAPEVLVFEDTEAGVLAAKSAGMRCLAVLGTLAPERLEAADGIVPVLDLDLLKRLL